MNVTYRIDNQILYIAIEGRIDASNANLFDQRIFEIKTDNPDKHVVLDADLLEYISSAGLRVILKLRKECPKLAIINVSPDVYEIFDMTGFTDMVKIEKAYPRLSIEGCEFIAKGANGAVYRYDEETIVKTYFAKDALPEILQERENARKVFVLGINTAIPYGIVRVGEGYGTVTELLNAKSITKIIIANPDDLEIPAKHYVNMLKSIHAVEIDDPSIPDMKDIAINWVEFLMPYLPSDKANKLLALVKAVPQTNTLLHGDYHSNNVMVQNGEPLLIDLDTVCKGHPIFELASMYNASLGFSEIDHSEIERFMGYTRETSRKFWDITLGMYLGTDDINVCKDVEKKARVIGYVRMLRRAIRRPNEPESPAKIEHCKKMLLQLLDEVDTLDF